MDVYKMLLDYSAVAKIILVDRFIDFRTTIWTVIQQAKKAQTTALNDFVIRYRKPVHDFIIKQGISLDKAEDLTQEVFFQLFKNKVLEKADKSKGRFRSLVLAVTKNMVKRSLRDNSLQKRKPEEGEISLEELQEDLNIIEKDHEFDKEWMGNLAHMALKNLKLENKDYYDVINLYLSGVIEAKDIAYQLKKDVKEVYNDLARGKQKLVEFIHDEIASYSSSKEEYEEESNYLSDFLG